MTFYTLATLLLATLLLAFATSAQALSTPELDPIRISRLSTRAQPANCALKINLVTKQCGPAFKLR